MLVFLFVSEMEHIEQRKLFFLSLSLWKTALVYFLFFPLFTLIIQDTFSNIEVILL